MASIVLAQLAMPPRAPLGLTCALIGAMTSSCFVLRSSEGGGETDPPAARTVRAADVAVPDGYRVEVVATGLTFPTGVAFDPQGRPHVVEAGYSYGEVFTTPRLLRVEPGGGLTEIVRGTPRDHTPWNGIAAGEGGFYVAQGGELGGGRIVRVSPDGEVAVLVDGLPSFGDHHTNGPLVASDGWIYFGQGTATNAGVVGPDNFDFGWLTRHPRFHDVPCEDVVLRGLDFASSDPRTGDPEEIVTGAYSPFGVPSEEGQRVAGEVPCSGAVLRVRPEGGPVELVAWGFRNPFGLAEAPDGTIYVTDNAGDARGSRPIFGGPDALWRLEPGRWYGWPDHVAGRPITADWFQQAGGAPVGPVLAEAPGTPPEPAALLAVHASANGFDVARAPFGHAGEAFIAEFGDMATSVGKVLDPVGFLVVRADPRTGVVRPFARNRAGKGPASLVGGGGLERPVAARFDPSGRSLYVVDFGVLVMDGDDPGPVPGTGALWRITRAGEGSR